MGLSASHELKQLNTRLTKAKVEADQAKDIAKEAQRNSNKLQQNVANIEKQIKVLQDQSKEMIVSEHALLRFIERIYEVDLDELKNQIITDEVVRQYDRDWETP